MVKSEVTIPVCLDISRYIYEVNFKSLVEQNEVKQMKEMLEISGL